MVWYLKGVYMLDKPDFAPVEGSAGKTYLNNVIYPCRKAKGLMGWI